MYEKYVSDELSAEEIINRVEAATPPSSPRPVRVRRKSENKSLVQKSSYLTMKKALDVCTLEPCHKKPAGSTHMGAFGRF